MTNLSEAIERYHSLLDPETAGESQAQLDEQQLRRGLFFGKRKICSVLRPRFLTTAQYQYLQGAIASIMPAFDKAYQAALAGGAIREQFKLADWEEKLIEADPGFGSPSPSSRMDSFFVTSENRLAFTEYNAEIPAAPAYNDALCDIFYGMRIMREFEKQYEVTSPPTRHHVLHALLDSYHQWGGRAKPNVAILDWREVPTYSEFVLFNEYFASQGLECRIIDPRDAIYEGGKLSAGGFRIDLIYKRVLITELVERCGIDGPVVRAVQERAACMVNPFRCKILHRKTSLAVLSDEQNEHLFSAAELEAIHAFIPWTRLLVHRKTTFKGQAVDLVPFIVEHQQEMVLKPSDEYGGKGIVLGWTVSAAEWEHAIGEYLLAPTVVQQRVTLPSEPYPDFVDGSIKVYDRMLDTDPYIWYGAYMSGCLTRISTAALLNVTAGGGSTVPTFVIEKRA